MKEPPRKCASIGSPRGDVGAAGPGLAVIRVARLDPISRPIWQPWLKLCCSQGCQIGRGIGSNLATVAVIKRFTPRRSGPAIPAVQVRPYSITISRYILYYYIL